MSAADKRTELDKKLQEIALQNWPQFVHLIGEQALLKAKSCLLRQEGKSYGEISVKTGANYELVRYYCKVCDE